MALIQSFMLKKSWICVLLYILFRRCCWLHQNNTTFVSTNGRNYVEWIRMRGKYGNFCFFEFQTPRSAGWQFSSLLPHHTHHSASPFFPFTSSTFQQHKYSFLCLNRNNLKAGQWKLQETNRNLCQSLRMWIWIVSIVLWKGVWMLPWTVWRWQVRGSLNSTRFPCWYIQLFFIRIYYPSNFYSQLPSTILLAIWPLFSRQIIAKWKRMAA